LAKVYALPGGKYGKEKEEKRELCKKKSKK
jgi:hypothetical protein